jgi:hypothetical protein
MPRRYPRKLKKRWSYFIRKVYETDPLICPKCQDEIRIISFIDQPGVIKKFFKHIDPTRYRAVDSWLASG